MRIIMLTSDFFPNIGGIAAHIFYLSKALKKFGVDVECVHVQYGNHKDTICEHDGLIVHKLYIANKIRKLRYLWLTYKVVRYIKKLENYKKIDIIHWHDLIPNALSTKLLSKKQVIIYTNHTAYFLQLFEKAKFSFLKLLLLHNNAVICPSKELYEKSRFIMKNKDVYYIANGVDIEKYRPLKNNEEKKKLRQKYGIDQNSFVVLCPRRWDPKNGIHYLIHSLVYIRRKYPAEFKEIKCLMVGSDYNVFPEYKKHLLQLIQKHDLTNVVILLGNKSQEEMVQINNISDLVVVPSLKEATSLSILEALSCEKPVIASDIPGIDEIIINGQNGVLVPPANFHSLAEAIIELFLNPVLRESLGKNGRKTVEKNFTWENTAKKVMEVYKRYYI